MQSSGFHSMQRNWDLATAAVQADALAVALEFKLFDHLEQPVCVTDIAHQFQFDENNTEYVLDLLWSMGLLRRTVAANDGRNLKSYQNSEDTRCYLVKGAPAYCGGAWLYRQRTLRQFGMQLRSRLQYGIEGAQSASLNDQAWAIAAREQIGQEQRAVTADASREIMARIPEFANARLCLDLGGGAGWVAIALASANTSLHGVVFDLPETVAVAQLNIAQVNLASRISVRAGDIDKDAIGEGYDLIWCSSVLHFVADITQTLNKIHAALRPGGVLVCAHAEISSVPDSAGRVLSYYLPLLMSGRHVTDQGELASTLRSIGFTNLTQHEARDFPMAPVQVLIGRRES